MNVLKNGNASTYNKPLERLTVSTDQGDRAYSLKHRALIWMQQRGLITTEPNNRVTLSDSADSWLSRNECAQIAIDPFRNQHQKLKELEIKDPAGLSQTVAAVDPESPLAWLRSRKDKHGVPFLSEAHYAAGERLRLDYARAALTPQMGMNWSANGKQNHSHTSAVGNANDAALDARDRINCALKAVGPELVRPLVDVCCHLRSLSDVEKSYNWPSRSGKAILKLSLQALARHYGLLNKAEGTTYASHIRHTGSADYRPTL
ncbi:MAG: DUF6456 domain-containing protein [Hyphomicrobiales bacterium]